MRAPHTPCRPDGDLAPNVPAKVAGLRASEDPSLTLVSAGSLIDGRYGFD